MNLTPLGGTIFLLFSDIEGSTRLREAHPQAMEAALRRHDAILREAFEAHGGYVFKTVGDAFDGAFHTAAQATAAALQSQPLLAEDGHDAVAADLLAAASAWYEDMSVTPQPKDVNVERRLEGETRRAIGEATYEAARHGGAVLDLRAAVALALEEGERLEGELA